MAAIVAVPVLTLIIMLGDYARVSIVWNAKNRQLKKLNSDIKKFEGGKIFQDAAEKRIETFNAIKIEVADVITQHIQWSPIFELLVKEMPLQLTLSDFVLRSETVNKTTTRREDPTKPLVINVPKRILNIGFYGSLNTRSDRMALKFLRSLGDSDVLKPRIERIRMVEQIADPERNTMYYTLECIFKP